MSIATGCHQTVKTADGRVLNYVDHTYHDFSKYFEEGGEAVSHKKAGKNFPALLHRILSEETEYSHIITWMVCFWSRIGAIIMLSLRALTYYQSLLTY